MSLERDDVEGDTKLEVVEIEETTWRGPLPPPERLAQYENVLPGASERIMSMAKQEQAHRHRQDERIFRISEKEMRYSFLSRVISGVVATGPFLVAGGSFFFRDAPAEGVVIVVSALAVWAVIGLAKILKGNDHDPIDGLAE